VKVDGATLPNTAEPLNDADAAAAAGPPETRATPKFVIWLDAKPKGVADAGSETATTPAATEATSTAILEHVGILALQDTEPAMTG